jgi:hypothetical protein
MTSQRVAMAGARGFLAWLVGFGVLVLPGCITGHEAEDEMTPDRSAELEDARTLEEIGAISETTYELKKARIESED